eukprot:1155174-Pelagomonas_calceolata.AAC.5
MAISLGLSAEKDRTHAHAKVDTGEGGVYRGVTLNSGNFWKRVCGAHGGGEQEKKSLDAQEHGGQPSRSPIALLAASRLRAFGDTLASLQDRSKLMRLVVYLQSRGYCLPV